MGILPALLSRSDKQEGPMPSLLQLNKQRSDERQRKRQQRQLKRLKLVDAKACRRADADGIDSGLDEPRGGVEKGDEHLCGGAFRGGRRWANA